MNNGQPQQSFDPMRVVKKLLLSGFVVLSFIAYALHKPSNSADAKPGTASLPPNSQTSTQLLAPTPSAQAATGAGPQQATTPTDSAAVDAAIADTATAQAPASTPTLPAPTDTVAAAATGQYKNGTYTGPEVDAFYGLVRVKTVIQNGKIANVTFLEYPSDRRTSQRINDIAMPWLQQEAVQAQNANVDIITGATLTSQAFMMSLQAALDQAKR